MSVQQLTKVTNPLQLSDVKQHLKVEYNDDDLLIARLMDAAIEIAENYADIVIRQSTWRWTLEQFETELTPPKWPLVSVESVAYTDPNGDRQTVANPYLRAGFSNTAILPEYGTSWPQVQAGYDSVRIEFTAGYVTMPEQIKHAVFMIITNLYENRQDDVDFALFKVPMSSAYLLDAYKRFGQGIVEGVTA